MDRGLVGASKRLRWACLGLATVIAILTVTSDPADARSRRKRQAVKKPAPAQTYNPPYAAIVVDFKTGATLHQAYADAIRHPASLTKIMTLYLLFEQMEAGRMQLSTEMEVSAAASVQAPTKLGLKPGQTLSVENAIKALVTKSANDAAVVVAEALAGSEGDFAREMTRKAHALGMSRTVYRNASGLPNSEQVTTARDQALLGIAIQERFPRYYRYFAMSSFVYKGHPMRNHNKLLGRVAGVDGIKTGFTNASGFNLVTSMKRSDRHIVAVVLGGRSGSQRDARMRSLIETHIAQASTRRTRTQIAETPVPAAPETNEGLPPKPPIVAAIAAAFAAPLSLIPPPGQAIAAMPPPPSVGSNEPIKPVKVKTVMVKVAPTKSEQTKTANPAGRNAPADAPAPAAAQVPVRTADASGAPPVAAVENKPTAEARRGPSGVLGALPAAVAAAGNAIVPKAAAAEAPAPARHPPRSGWSIQIGAFEDETEAKQQLSAARSKAAGLLGKADPYTERTVKGEKTFYRARFAGFDRNSAHATCKQLKRNDIVCMALRN
jgi:D-alanyl-D-alanine carboxypeptidase